MVIANCKDCMAWAVLVSSSWVKSAAFFTKNFSVTSSICSASVLASTKARILISALAWVKLSNNLCSTSSSVNPYCGFISMVWLTPLLNSFALTCKIPSALIKNRTSTFGKPAGMEGIPFKVNAPNCRLSFTKSRSP